MRKQDLNEEVAVPLRVLCGLHVFQDQRYGFKIGRGRQHDGWVYVVVTENGATRVLDHDRLDNVIERWKDARIGDGFLRFSGAASTCM